MRLPTRRAAVAAAILLAALLPAAPGRASGNLRSFTLNAGGDILLQAAVAAAGATGLPGTKAYDFVPLLRPIEPWISDADFALCHLESTLSADNTTLLYDESGWPRFSGPYQVAAALAAVGYDACSLASNHAWDRGRAGIAETIEVLDRYAIVHTGTARTPEERLPALLEVNGVRVALISYSTGTNFRPLPSDAPWVMNVMDTAAILADARWAREQGAEFTIVSLHWGTPYQVRPDAPQEQVAAVLTASPDVDLILGHHTHMVQPITRMNGKLVVYGMGDLLSDIHGGPGRGAGAGDGFLIHLTVTEQPGGSFTVDDPAVTPIWVDPATLRVLPIDHTLANGADPTLAPRLDSSRALTLERLGLLGWEVTVTPTPWPPLLCRGRPATIVGTAGPDVLVGTPGDDVIAGRGGNDLILGLGGDDLICGGDGDDLIWGGDGDDELWGGEGNDRLYGEAGADRLYGEAGNDVLWGGPGPDFLSGGDGDDTLLGHEGDDLLIAGPGRDYLWGGTGNDVLVGYGPEDSLSGDENDTCRVGGVVIAACPPG